MAYDFTVRTRQDLIDAVQEYGIVPYFSTSIPGFSLEEHCPPAVLFSDTGEDTWAWKGPVIRATGCAYGKFFEKKSAYVSREVFLDLANYRRDGYDFDARYDDGLAKYSDKELFELIDRLAPVVSKDDTSVTRLQEQCYVIISDFVYTLDKHGNKRGWGVAEYSTPEKVMGKDFSDHVYRRTPAESRERLLQHLAKLFPHAAAKDLKRFLK